MALRRLERTGTIATIRPPSGLKAKQARPGSFLTFTGIRPVIPMGILRRAYPMSLVYLPMQAVRVKWACFSPIYINNFSLALRTEILPPAMNYPGSMRPAASAHLEDGGAGWGQGVAYPSVTDRSSDSGHARYDAWIFPAIRSPAETAHLAGQGPVPDSIDLGEESTSIGHTADLQPVCRIMKSPPGQILLESRILRHITTFIQPDAIGCLLKEPDANPGSGTAVIAAASARSLSPASLFSSGSASEPGHGQEPSGDLANAKGHRSEVGQSNTAGISRSTGIPSLSDDRYTRRVGGPVIVQSQAEAFDRPLSHVRQKEHIIRVQEKPRLGQIEPRISVTPGPKIPSEVLSLGSNQIAGLGAVNTISAWNMAGIMGESSQYRAPARPGSMHFMMAHPPIPKDEAGLLRPSPDRCVKQITRVFRYGASAAGRDELQPEVVRSREAERPMISNQIAESGPVQPIIRPQDLGRISDQICSIIERRLKIEKERRGIYG